MILVSISRDTNQNIMGFEVKGHAKYGEYGQDIVCASISAISFTGVAGLLNLAGGCQWIQQEGYMKCFIKEDANVDQTFAAHIILDTVYLGFKQIEKQYKQYVRVLE